MNVQSAASSKASPRLESPLSVAHTALDVAQAHTVNLLNELAENLTPVLTPAQITKEDSAGRGPGQSDLHEQVLKHLDQQERINNTIRALIDRSTV